MSWISQHKLYEGYGLWYCNLCQRRTETELNPEWIADGSPHNWQGKRYPWIARCARCQYEKFVSSYACPHCGKPVNEGQEPLNKIEPVLNPYYSYEFGVTGYDWVENHRCTTCGRRYWFSNGTC